MIKRSERWTNIISIALCGLLVTNQGSFAAGLGAGLTQTAESKKQLDTQLTLTMALDMAFKNNKTINGTQNQWQGKRLEIESLENKLVDLGKSQTGLKLDAFSKPEPDAEKKKIYAEQVALISSLNQKKDELKQIEWDYRNAVITMTYNVKALFFDILENTEAYAYEVENSRKLEENYIKLYPQYLQGLVKSETIKANRDNYSSSQERQVKILLAIDQLKAKLTTQLGNVDIGSWTYDSNIPDYSLSDSVLTQLYPYAVHHETQLLTLEKKFDETQCLLDTLNDIYLQAYGEQGKWIYPMIHDKQVDYPLLFENLKSMTASQSLNDMSLVYPLRYGFFKVSTDDNYFLELPTALKLMKEASPLTEAISQREESRGLLNEGYVTLQKNYRGAYEAYMQLDFDLEQLREELITNTAKLEKLRKLNLLGQTTYSDFQALVIKVNDQRRSERVLHIKRNKSIAALDFVSAGAVGQLGNLQGFENVTQNLSGPGDTFGKSTNQKIDSESQSVYWKVENPTDYYGFVLLLSPSETLKVTTYQVFDSEGKVLSERLNINQVFMHENFPYKKGMQLKVVLYQKDKVIKEGTLSGDQLSGRF